MKPIAFFFLAFIYYTASAQVGIGTTAPNPAAQLDVSATNKGILIPRLSAAQKKAMGTPANCDGLLVYLTDSVTGFYYYSSGVWSRLGAAGPQGEAGPVGPQGEVGPVGPQGVKGDPGVAAPKTLTGFINATTIQGTGFTVQRLANQQYVVSWPAGTFPNAINIIPLVMSFSGGVSLSSFGNANTGAGSFTTNTNVGNNIWFTVSEVK